MKDLNSLVFLGLMVMVAGCQKKDNAQPKKADHKHSAKVVKEKKDSKKKDSKKLEPKKSEHKKSDHKKLDHKHSKKCGCNVKLQGYYDGSGE